MFERVEYIVRSLDGDYAYLELIDQPQQDLKCVARALLPPETGEGTKLAYEMMSYSVIDS